MFSCSLQARHACCLLNGMLRRIVPLLLLALFASSTSALAQGQDVSTQGAETQPSDRSRTFSPMGEARQLAGTVMSAVDPMVELLDTELPQTLAKYRLELSFKPKARDFLDEDYVRFPVELRYGINSRTDAWIGLEPFTPNPFQSGDQWGFTYLRLGTKYQLPRTLRDVKIAVGARMDYPISSPEYPGGPMIDGPRKPLVQPNDGFMRIEPYIVFERRLNWMRNLHGFINLGYQYAEFVRGGDEFRQYLESEQVFLEDNARITAGLIQYRGVYNPFLRAEYRWETAGRYKNDAWYIEPGMLFDLTRNMTRPLPGKWSVEAGLRYEVWEGQDDIEFNVRVKWRVKLAELGIRRGDGESN